ncbi:MAG: LpxL/LpxP family Kdo(2)-lipid IV(A) lauroyl/palmitoleoyl acyltransferase [Nevskia sp.]|nr:LpxL/LpxP family Kdo(2)-lipid IV(A) lauroyl/palmitoleoyl acyltransferase [Nevskia sp.]
MQPTATTAAPAALPPRPLPRALLAPRHWPGWLGLGLLRLLALLPLPLLRALGAGLGELFHALVPSRRRIVRINLRLCFPELSEAQRRRLARAHFRALGMGLFEVPVAWFASDRRLRRCTEFVGVEHLRQACADGRGVLLLTGHFSTMELGCRLVHLAGFPFHGMYRRADSAFADYWMCRLREARLGLPMVPKEDLKRIVRLLRRGGLVWYGPDQTLEAANAVFVPFFGQPALTLTATSRLADMGRARVVPYFPQRVNGRYRLVFEPALENFPSGDDTADAARINALLEQAIRQVPEQYFWVHRRFKDGPPGRRDPYAR